MLNRTIWTYWHQGMDCAPKVVQLCIESWRLLNPGWRLMVLDERSLAEAVDLGTGKLDRPDITVQKVAALARLCLLRAHGGVWVDATVFCRRPLDEWLPEHAASGFFAFANPGVDRLMSNWFIAATHDHLLLGELHRAFTALWRGNVYWNQNTRFGALVLRRLRPILSRDVRRTRLWLSWPIRRLLGVYPYFQFHYTFNRLVLNDARCREAWAAVKPLSADPPHSLLRHFHHGGTAEDAVADIEAGVAPVFKLDWRLDPETPYWTAVLGQLRATLEAA